jgi:hypothetical protein
MIGSFLREIFKYYSFSQTIAEFDPKRNIIDHNTRVVLQKGANVKDPNRPQVVSSANSGKFEKESGSGKDVPRTVWAPVYVYFEEKTAINHNTIFLTDRLTLECCSYLSFLKDLFGKSKLLKANFYNVIS